MSDIPDNELSQLNIDIICANTPQAKGRVERANLTLQDRLVKELRLQNICTVEEANEFLETYIRQHNRRFAVPPENSYDAHRNIRADENLEDILSWQETRRVSKNLVVHFNRKKYHIFPNEQTIKIAQRSCTVYEWD